MTAFTVEPGKLNQSTTEITALANDLRKMADEVDSVRSSLSGEACSNAEISASLRAISTALTEESAGVLRFSRALTEIVTLYQNTEKENVEARTQLAMQAASFFDIFRRNGKSLIKDSDRKKDKFIEKMEKKYPGLAREFDDFLKSGKGNRLTEDDIRNIKYLAYKAKEPYRTIFIKNVDRFVIGNADETEGAYFRPSDKTVNYSYPDSFKDDVRGPYTTFFHECGHAVDDMMDLHNGVNADTNTMTWHSDKLGRDITLREAIEHDVFYNKDNPHSVTSVAEKIIKSGKTGSSGNVQNVIDAFRDGSKGQNLSKNDKLLYNAVVNEHRRATSDQIPYESISDVYGGMTHNALANGFEHAESYWNNPNSAGSELWAEYFSYNMAGNKENLSNLQKFFPESVKMLDAYSEEIKNIYE